MVKFNNIKELEKYMNKQMSEVMNNEMAQMVKKKESESVEKNVYQAYQPSSPDGEPWKYERRRTNGGLADIRNMTHEVINSGNGVELTVENKTKGKDQNFEIDDLVEYGDGYNGKEYEFKKNRDGTAQQYLRPRPFTQRTKEDILMTNKHVDTMRKGLKSRGIDVQ